MSIENKGTVGKVIVNLGNKENPQNKKITVLKLTDEQIPPYVAKYTGQKIDWGGALTVFNKKTDEPQILISQNLPENLQEVLLEHEKAQLEVILKWTAEGRPKHSILQLAHDIGVQVGTKKAEEIGIIKLYEEYRNKPLLNKK